MKLNWKGLAALAAVAVAAFFVVQYSSDKAQQEAQEAEDRAQLEAMVHEIQKGVTPPPPRGVVQRNLKPLPALPIPEDMQEVPEAPDEVGGSRTIGAGSVLRNSRRQDEVLHFVDRFAASETLSENTKDQLRNILLSESDAQVRAWGTKDAGRVASSRREAEKLARSLLTKRQFDEFLRMRENQRRTPQVPFK